MWLFIEIINVRHIYWLNLKNSDTPLICQAWDQKGARFILACCYMQFCVTAAVLELHSLSEECTIWISPSSAGSGSSGSCSMLSAVFTAAGSRDQETPQQLTLSHSHEPL
jgi:hypothetical protein